MTRPKTGADDFIASGLTEAALTDLPGVVALGEPTTSRVGDDFVFLWPGADVQIDVTAVREHSEGITAELAVSLGGGELHWGRLGLASTPARMAFAKRLAQQHRALPWGTLVEQACRLTAQAMRTGDPFITLTGTLARPSRVLVRDLLYAGEPTAIIGDGDTGKSLTTTALAVAVSSGTALPFGLAPAQAVPVAYFDWETTLDTVDARVALLAAGLGVPVPLIFYKPMTRPLQHEARALATECARRRVGFVIIDSMMFAVAGGEGGGFHEPITAFYTALRLFAPAAILVVSHITGADARTNGPARPYGGAFAFNGPRLVWEAKRDRAVSDATAIAFTCIKHNNLASTPEPFGLRFAPAPGAIMVSALDLAQSPTHVVVGASLSYHVRLALARGVEEPETIVEDLRQIGKPATIDTIKRLLRLERQRTRQDRA